MTIAAAWVRTLDTGTEELLVCSDSRLCGGKRFDQCQKTFRLSRTDAAICFAGGTDWAYPMIVAAVKAADLHVPSNTRALSLPKFKSHVVNILTSMQREVHNYSPGENVPDVTFLLGGYDWWSKSFRIWRLLFDQSTGVFKAEERVGSNGFGGLGKIEIAGDENWVAAVRERIKGLAQQRYGLNMRQPDNARFNLEPFEAICDLMRTASANDTIGGAPQGIKVYQYMNSADLGVFWPDTRTGRLFVSGRPLLDYERANIMSVLDPNSLVSTWSSGNTADALTQLDRASARKAQRAPDDEADTSTISD